MRAILQRVLYASVKVNNIICGEIDKGLLVFVGIGNDDTEEDADKMAAKLSKLRIFSDENDKINLSINDVGGGLLIISQFTLYADCQKGNRPNFTMAARPDKAEKLYNYFINICKKYVPIVQSGIFGADMKVELLNDGPFTVILEQ
jgi:D-tyrosyl-tRNA(Tyr) deacylase